jgi:chromosomal replication initiation ATPase DnaA
VPSHDAADFLVGDGNRLAYLHLLAYPDWPGPLTLLVGPPSSGKSHLAGMWAARAGAETLHPEATERLAAAAGTTPLLIEDVDRPGYDERALFHLLNQSMRDRRPLLLTARQPVSNWPYATEDLRSRARLATLLLVSPAGDTELSQVLVKLFGDRQVTVDPRIIGYLVPRMERSPAEAVALVHLIDQLALARGTAITRAIAGEALAQRRRLRGGASARLELEADDE